VIKNEDAVIQSMKNLMLTSFNERWNEKYGGNVRGSLFELPSVITEDSIQHAAQLAIQNFEQRASLISVVVSFRPDENTYAITITFSVINILQPITTTIFLQRVR
jgi:phage baseplate assembly protein W